jgi:hypothetical protein
MSPTQGMKSSEFLTLIAGLLCAVIPVVLDKVPAESIWAVVLGTTLAAATYIAGRSLVKVSANKAEAIKATVAGALASKDQTSNP